MSILRLPCIFLLALSSAGAIPAQEAPVPQLLPGSARKPAAETAVQAQTPSPQMVPLTVPKGTSLQVALEQEVRIKKVGEPIHGRIVEPVYALDRLVVPVGSEITGEVTKIDAISSGKRTLSVLNADFTPLRNFEVGFKELVLPDGRHLSLHTSVTPDSGQLVQFVTAPETKDKKSIKDKAAKKYQGQSCEEDQRSEAAGKTAMGCCNEGTEDAGASAPARTICRVAAAGSWAVHSGRHGVLRRVGRSAGLWQRRDDAASRCISGGPLPEGAVVRARLLTPLSSATAEKGQDVEAVLSRPLFDGDRLILPQGSRLKGTVRQVQPARRMKKNGQLRIAFLELVPPDGIEQKVHATLEGVQAGKDANVKLDSEGGAEATTSKSRYLATTVSLGLAAMSLHGDSDEVGNGSAGNTGNRVAGGAAGFKLVGMTLGVLVHSRAFGYTMGAYGAGMSVYSHFIARGQEVVFPKNTAMEIGIGTRAGETRPTGTSPDGGGQN